MHQELQKLLQLTHPQGEWMLRIRGEYIGPLKEETIKNFLKKYRTHSKLELAKSCSFWFSTDDTPMMNQYFKSENLSSEQEDTTKILLITKSLRLSLTRAPYLWSIIIGITVGLLILLCLILKHFPKDG